MDFVTNRSARQLFGQNKKAIKNNPQDVSPVPQPFCTKKRVAQYDLQGKLIATYESYRAAAKAVNGTPSAISRICSGAPGLHTHKGFEWQIVEEIVQQELEN